MVAKRRHQQSKLTKNIKSLLKTTTLLTASALTLPGRANANNTLGTVGKLKILILENSLAKKAVPKFNIHMFFGHTLLGVFHLF
jgi:hypothetical protein